MSETEHQELTKARNRALYEGYKNSLIEWTLSDEWTQVDRHDKPIPRGLLRKCGFLITLNSCSGEIECPE